MAVLDDFKGASIFVKIAFILILLGSLFASIAFTCTGWGVSGSVTKTYYGLWRFCVDSSTSIVSACSVLEGTANGAWSFTQAGSCFGFIGLLITCVLVVLYIFVRKCQKNGEVGMAAGIIAIVAGAFFLIACITFGAQWHNFYKDTTGVDNNLGYGFALAIIASLLAIVGGVLFIVECKEGGGVGSSDNPSGLK